MEKRCQAPLKTCGGGGLTWDSEVPLGAHPHVLRIYLVTAISPGDTQPSHSVAAQPHLAPSAAPHNHQAHPGNAMWTLRLPSAAAVTTMVDISTWSFLSRKTLQSDTMKTTNQRPENCKAARWVGGLGTQGTKLTAQTQDLSEVTQPGLQSVHLLGLSPRWTRALFSLTWDRSHHL